MTHFFELFRRVDHFRRSCVKSYWEQCGKSDPIALLTPRLRIHLFAVMLCEPCSLQAFMNHTGLSAPAASAAIDKLVRRGMVIRSQSETDRRSVVLTMEPEMRRAMHEIDRLFRERLLELFKECPPELVEKFDCCCAVLLKEFDRRGDGMINH